MTVVKRHLSFIIASLLAVLSTAAPTAGWAQTSDQPSAVDQGPVWTPEKRSRFYSLDQGSRIIPLNWLRAFKSPDGKPFLHDGLVRYGYLPDAGSLHNLPLGLTATGPFGEEMLGITCAACHTRDIRHDGKTYRVDGAPAMIDFQAFLRDIDMAATTVAVDPNAYKEFSRALLGPNTGTAVEDQLRWSFRYWYNRYHTLVRGSLPEVGRWGVGRLDAVAMIFNRLAGLDLGLPAHDILEQNIEPALAPVRYPFLWNVHRQTRVQWTGIADNTTPVGILARNIGQAIGVFAEFQPGKKNEPNGDRSLDFFAVNSVQFANLQELEVLMSQLGSPKWPWDLDETMAVRGEEIFKQQCDGCHGIKEQGGFWKTCVLAPNVIRTDARAVMLLNRDVDTGILADAGMAQREKAAKVLKFTTDTLAMLVLQKPGERTRIHAGPSHADAVNSLQMLLQSQNAAPSPEGTDCSLPPNEPGYAAKVLNGIWAAAPYLHNGSVPTLRDLLEPSTKRPPAFEVGPVYDPKRVGLAAQQTGLTSTLTTTSCTEIASGNSRCGHEYGTNLPDEDKNALLEYLKKL